MNPDNSPIPTSPDEFRARIAATSRSGEACKRAVPAPEDGGKPHTWLVRTRSARSCSQPAHRLGRAIDTTDVTSWVSYFPAQN